MTDMAISAQRRRQVELAADEWRRALIDVSGSNRLLFFKPTAATLDLGNAPDGPLAELFAGNTVSISKLFPDPTMRVAAERTCKALAAKAKVAAEEYGVSVAFLAIGMASWDRSLSDRVIDDEDLESQESKGGSSKKLRDPQAPVLLRAIDVRLKPGTESGFELVLTGEPQLNPVLLHVLASLGARIEEESLLEASGDDSDNSVSIFNLIRKVCSDIPSFGIVYHLVAGAFSYLKQPMVRDCENIDALVASDLVAALAGDADAITAVKSQAGDIGEADPDYQPVEAEHLILDADASQSFVVNAALAGRNLVVQGPPGTGKSQTIANVIACLVAEGKTVLFVVQKRAAITACSIVSTPPNWRLP